jgi:TonB family protein
MRPKALPYLLFSLIAHGGLLLTLLLWRIPPEPEPAQRRVELVFGRPAPGRRTAARQKQAQALPGLPVPEGRALSPPPARAGGGKAVLLPEAPRSLPGAPPRVSEARGTAALPTAAQVLRGLLPEPAAAPAPSAVSEAPAEPAARQATSESPGYTPATALEWNEGERTLLRRPRLRFPQLLLDKGLEVDVEAAFVVAPDGQVIRVQITRSSGFASVDREVEQALRDALFAESSREDTGRIQFRFRLERK